MHRLHCPEAAPVWKVSWEHGGSDDIMVSAAAMSTAPLTDLLVLQGHLCPIGSSSSLGSPPREKDII